MLCPKYPMWPWAAHEAHEMAEVAVPSHRGRFIRAECHGAWSPQRARPHGSPCPVAPRSAHGETGSRWIFVPYPKGKMSRAVEETFCAALAGLIKQFWL